MEQATNTNYSKEEQDKVHSLAIVLMIPYVLWSIVTNFAIGYSFGWVFSLTKYLLGY